MCHRSCRVSILVSREAYGYLPTPEQHALGGYETWLGTNLVEVDASTKIEQTIDDPVNYTRPFTTRLNWRLQPDAEIMEMVCTENNLSVQHLVPRSN